MELLGSIAVMAATLLAIFIGFCILASLWSEGFGDSSPVLLEQMLRRQGDEVARCALASGDRHFARAIRRCSQCAKAAQCRAWLHSGAREGYQTFCPNAGLVQRMTMLAT